MGADDPARGVIACRLACYRPHTEQAAAHLRELGIRFVEVRLPPGADAADLLRWSEGEAQRLASHGLSATTVQGDLDLARADTAAQVAALAPAALSFSCPRLFIALRPLAVSQAVQCERLRSAGAAAADRGMTIVLETHPDLTASADQALRTLERVDHSAVRLNFDTGNVYFYNRGLDCVDELRRVVHAVESLHLKDTSGRFEDRSFPALGMGVVDFGGVFEVLDSAGFRGPCTIEVEGEPGEERTAARILGRIAESAVHLRRLGRL